MPVYDKERNTLDPSQGEESLSAKKSGADPHSLSLPKVALEHNDLANREASTSPREDSASSIEKSGLFNRNNSKITRDDLFNAAATVVPGGPMGKIAFRLFNKKLSKRSSMIVGGGSLLFGVSLFLMVIASGPLGIINFAEMLKKYHLQSIEDFSDDRGLRTRIYGLPKNQTRLGLPGNIVADKWERKLFKETGLRPVYTSTGRFIGFEMVDEKKAEAFLGDVGEKENKKLEQVMGNGAKIVKAKDTADNVRPRTPGGNPVNGDRRIVDLSEVSFADRSVFIKAVNNATDSNRAVISVASRLMIKRAGIKYHPLNKYKDRYDKARDGKKNQKEIDAAEKEVDEQIDKEAADYIQNGSESAETLVGAAKNEDGTTTAANETAANETKGALSEVKLGKSVKPGPQAVIGVLCGMRAYGKGIDTYQYVNNVLPAMRMAAGAISTGDQIKDMSDFDMKTLSKISKKYYNSEDKSSYSAAQLVQAEQGKDSGVPPPPEAQLSRVGKKKPELFSAVEDAPGLGTACSVSDFINSLPGISQLNSILEGVTNKISKATLGVTPDQLVEKSMKVLVGKAINPKASGAEFGNVASIGARLYSNDMFFSMGGAFLSASQAAELKQIETIDNKNQYASLSLKDRYFSVFNPASFSNKMIFSATQNIQNSDALLLPVNQIANVFSTYTNSESAKAAINIDSLYGVPRAGFSLSEQRDQKFENPYENAVVVEPKINELNDKYGKCFGIKIILDANDTSAMPKIETDKSVNPFLLMKKTDGYENCGDSSGPTSIKTQGTLSLMHSINPFSTKRVFAASTNNAQNEDYVRYRFYIADTVSALSSACREGIDEACSNFGDTTAQNNDESATVSAEKVSVEDLGKDSDNISCAPGTKDLGTTTSKYTGELKKESGPLKIRLCQVSSIPGSGADTSGKIISGGAVVDARVSGAWNALAKAAKADGINLEANSSFRLFDSCGGTGDGVACARPGQSFHQTGYAIDFGNGMTLKGTSTSSCGGRARLPNNKAWKWLDDHAEDYGIKQYTYESWHWDFAPLPNRCGKGE